MIILGEIRSCLWRDPIHCPVRTHYGDVTIYGAVTHYGDLTHYGDVTLYGNLTHYGDVTLYGDVTRYGDLTHYAYTSYITVREEAQILEYTVFSLPTRLYG
ncbi:hypothetical protein J6590_024774 [Homalodisca vitripennis]|nr:hypothetical protein J6590_024774 [Homalodisca vitripennis]